MNVSEIISVETLHKFCDENSNDSEQGVINPCTCCELYEKRLCQYWSCHYESGERIVSNIIAYNRKAKLEKLLS